jgi:PAS domain S-box-containing protein
MPQTASVPAIASARAIQAEQVRQLYAGVPAGPAGGALAALVLALVLWDMTSRPLLIGWVAGLLLVLGLGALAGVAYQRTPADRLEPRVWLLRFRIAVGIAGTIWGMASLLVFPTHNMAYQAFFGVMLLGVAAAAVTAMAVDLRSALLFTVPLLVPLIVRLFAQGEGIFTAMAAMVLVFLVYIGMSAVRADRSARHNRELRNAETAHVNALRESAAQNRKLALAMAHINDSVMILDASGRIEWVNPSFVRTTGYALEEVAGRKPGEVLRGPQTDPVTAARIDELLQKGQRVSAEILNYAKGGRSYWSTIGTDLIHDEAGRIIHFISVSRDITQRKTTDEALQLALHSAQSANRAKSDFLASMSHELRTPLNAILGYAQLMAMRDDLPDDVMESADEIRHAGDHLLALVNDVLDLARIETGGVELHLETLAPAELLAACRAQNLRAAQTRHIQLLFDDRCTDHQVMADRRRLLQVLNNLISNAIKYNRDHGQVQVRCQAEAATVRFSVTDTGPGITADKQSQLFQPFNRLGAEMGPVEGTGIGLVITRQLVADMNGSMGFVSEPGQGTTFWAEFPSAQRSQPVAAVA